VTKKEILSQIKNTLLLTTPISSFMFISTGAVSNVGVSSLTSFRLSTKFVLAVKLSPANINIGLKFALN
jgi:hypothetical protein